MWASKIPEALNLQTVDSSIVNSAYLVSYSLFHDNWMERSLEIERKA